MEGTKCWGVCTNTVWKKRHDVYLERAVIFFTANDIAENKKEPLLLNCIGVTVYRVLCNLVAPENPINTSYDNMTKKILEHFDPKPLTVVGRFHFHKRGQAMTKSLAEYLAELHWLASRCYFGAYLDEAVLSAGSRARLYRGNCCLRLTWIWLKLSR